MLNPLDRKRRESWNEGHDLDAEGALFQRVELAVRRGQSVTLSPDEWRAALRFMIAMTEFDVEGWLAGVIRRAAEAAKDDTEAPTEADFVAMRFLGVVTEHLADVSIEALSGEGDN